MQFKYLARTQTGEQQEGVLEAGSEAEAVQAVEHLGYIPVSIVPNVQFLKDQVVKVDKFVLFYSAAIIVSWCLPWHVLRSWSNPDHTTYGFQVATGLRDGTLLFGIFVPICALLTAVATLCRSRILTIMGTLLAGFVAISHGITPVIRFGFDTAAYGAHLSTLFGIAMLTNFFLHLNEWPQKTDVDS